ncbi:MAG: M14 family metallopeptidase [Hyphomicrobiales bacterium]
MTTQRTGPVSSHFAGDYQEAREKFIDAANLAGGDVRGYPHPMRGPDGEELALDLAWFGPDDATAAVIVASATHGVEGFCGSGCQVAALEAGLHHVLPGGAALVMVHAHNPYGFAHIRRVTEGNIDLNRNFLDFSAPLPDNPGYAEVHAWLTPADWGGPEHAAADQAIDDYIAANGFPALQTAVAEGQCGFPDGLFYCGSEPTWSRVTIETICATVLSGLERAVLLDLHTGLGPRGYGELIVSGSGGRDELERARAWFGGDVKGISESVSTVTLDATVGDGYFRALSTHEVTAVTIEYGTVPVTDVMTALRAENWLHHHGDVQSAQGREIKAMLRDAFYGDDDPWRLAVCQRAEQVIGQAITGISD